MKKIFIDTNVIIDLLLKRDGYAEAALIMESGKQGIISLYASVLTMANLASSKENLYIRLYGQYPA